MAFPKNHNHVQRSREKIAATKVLDKLLKCFDGEIEMTPQQVSIGLKLVNKMVPDLKQTDSVAEITHNLPTEIKVKLVDADAELKS